MSFKENLLKKIRLDKRREDVLRSLNTASGIVTVDKQSMRHMLDQAGLRHIKLRNIDIFIPEDASETEANHVFVLDNELAVYNTTVNDVLLRKEPTLKEMISIRNAIKILNDSDVIVSKKEVSVEYIYQKCLAGIDCSFTDADIKQLEYDGRAAVEWKDSSAIKEVLLLFGELLGFSSAPKALRVEHATIAGVKSLNNKDEEVFSPLVVYSLTDDSLKLIQEAINIKERESLDLFHNVAKGLRDPSLQGPSVIKYLAEAVLKKHKVG